MDVEDDSAFEYDDDEEYPVGEEDWGDEAAGGEDGGGDGGAAGGAAAGGAGDSGGGAAAAAPPAPAGHPAFVKQTSYVTTDVAGMAATMQGRINHCAALFDVTIDEAIVLLMVYSWREDRLQEAWVEDPGRVRRRAGVTAGPDPPALPVEAATTPAFEDPVSFDTCAWADTDALPCGHRASKAVWHDAVAAAIRDPNAALLARCIAAGDGCVEVIRPRMFRSYLPPTDAAKYDAALLRSFAATNPHIRFCPGAGCDQVIIYEGGGAHDVTCGAGHSFCFVCRGAAHRPASCAEYDKWSKRIRDDGENAKWLLANTKPCPSCKKPIQKNEGCIHMTCQRSAGGCGHEFCWMCSGKWATHGGYQCNKPPPAAYYDEKAASSAKQELTRFAFYEERYRNHLQSEALAVKLAPRITENIELLTANGLSFAFAEFLEEARTLIVWGRHVAAYTYVHAFYISNPVEMGVFQDMQGRLEHNLEQLHEAVEGSKLRTLVHDATAASVGSITGDLMELRGRVVHLADATRRFTRNVIDAVDVGLLLDTSAVPPPMPAPAPLSAAAAAAAATTIAAAVAAAAPPPAASAAVAAAPAPAAPATAAAAQQALDAARARPGGLVRVMRRLVS